MNLNQITIPVTDVEKSIEFYKRLGNRLIVKAVPRYARFECTEGESTFSLNLVAKLGDSSITIYFEVLDLDFFC